MKFLNRFEIPKEIKTKPKLLGLEIREMAILLLLIILTLTFFKDMVHKVFVIPYFFVAIGSIFYMISPSSNNPKKKNYQALLLYFKRDKSCYHAMDVNVMRNKQLSFDVRKQNEDVFGKEKIHKGYLENIVEDEKIKGKSKVSNEREEEKELVDDVEHRNDSEPECIEQVKYEETGIEECIVVDEPTNDVPKVMEQEGYIEKVSLKKDYVKKAAKNKKKSGGNKLFGFIFLKNKKKNLLLDALRSYALQDYEKSSNFFEKIEYHRLESVDQEIMLLAHLFNGQAKRAIELNPEFAETVVNYYKSKGRFEAIRQLAMQVKSRILDFEVAVDNGDYWKVIELKEFVTMDEERHQNIVKAYVELGNLHKARQYADETGDRKLINFVKEVIGEEKSSDKVVIPERANLDIKPLSMQKNGNGEYVF